MNLRRNVLVGAFSLALLGSVAFYLLSPVEPSYQGKKLSVWMDEAAQGSWPRPTTVLADEAIRQIGTNAFPMIVHKLNYRDSGLTTLLRNRAPQVVIRLGLPAQNRQHMQAVSALHALGPVAKPLVPEVAAVLGKIEILPGAAQWLSNLGPDAEAAIPALIGILKDKRQFARHVAAQPLAHIAIHRRGDVVPALEEVLTDTNQFVRSEAKIALKMLSSPEGFLELSLTGMPHQDGPPAIYIDGAPAAKSLGQIPPYTWRLPAGKRTVRVQRNAEKHFFEREILIHGGEIWVPLEVDMHRRRYRTGRVGSYHDF